MKQYPTAISLFKQMELKGIRNDLVNLNIFINCFWHLSQMALAFSVFSKVLKLGYHPDVVTLTTLIRGLFLNDEVKKALNFHDKVVAQAFIDSIM